VDVAVEILKYALYKEVKGKKPKAKKARVDGDVVEDEEEEEKDSDASDVEQDFDQMDETEKQSTLRYGITSFLISSKSSGRGKSNGKDTVMDEESEGEEEIYPRAKASATTAGGFDASQSGISDLIDDSQEPSASSAAPVSRERMLFFEARLGAARKSHVNGGGDHDQMGLAEVLEGVNIGLRGGEVFRRGEVEACLRVLGDDNRVWYREAEELVMFM
jgi:hypothetical protein